MYLTIKSQTLRWDDMSMGAGSVSIMDNVCQKYYIYTDENNVISLADYTDETYYSLSSIEEAKNKALSMFRMNEINKYREWVKKTNLSWVYLNDTLPNKHVLICHDHNRRFYIYGVKKTKYLHDRHLDKDYKGFKKTEEVKDFAELLMKNKNVRDYDVADVYSKEVLKRNRSISINNSNTNKRRDINRNIIEQ